MLSAPMAGGVIDAATALGFAAVLAADAGRGRLSVAALIAWLQVPVRLGQAMIHVDAGRVLGMCTWAYVAPPVLVRLRRGEGDLLAPEEWNEGTIPWIVDLMSPYGRAADLVRLVRKRLGADHGVAFYRRGGALRRLPLLKA